MGRIVKTHLVLVTVFVIVVMAVGMLASVFVFTFVRHFFIPRFSFSFSLFLYHPREPWAAHNVLIPYRPK